VRVTADGHDAVFFKSINSPAAIRCRSRAISKPSSLIFANNAHDDRVAHTLREETISSLDRTSWPLDAAGAVCENQRAWF